MPETRVVETKYKYPKDMPAEDKVVANAEITEIMDEISDEQLAVEAVEQETEQANDQALVAYQNYDSLSLAQKDRVLKALLGDLISRNRTRYIGV